VVDVVVVAAGRVVVVVGRGGVVVVVDWLTVTGVGWAVTGTVISVTVGPYDASVRAGVAAGASGGRVPIVAVVD
jgi:hypothetical protein